MKKTINTLIFNVLLVLIGHGILNAAPILLTEDNVLSLSVSNDNPITVSTNFEISNADLVVINEKYAALKLLKKGFIFIPKVKSFKATVVLTARNGNVYTINLRNGGSKSVFKLEDPLQTLKTNTKKFNYESGRIDQDARNIIKTVLLGKPLSGYKKTLSSQKIVTKQYTLRRIERFTGNKYVVDGWTITNTSNDSLYFIEEDFYTKGILAIALQKNRLLKNESMFLYMIINKNAAYQAEKRAKYE